MPTHVIPGRPGRAVALATRVTRLMVWGSKHGGVEMTEPQEPCDGRRSPCARTCSVALSSVLLVVTTTNPAVATASAVAAASALIVQDREPQHRGYRADVDLVIVDAVVRDASGEHVVDLDAGDFTVREDGKPVAISFFQREGYTTGAPADGIATPRNFVLLVDGLNSGPVQIGRIRAVLHGFIDGLRETDRVMLAALVPDGRLLVPVKFPGDRAALHHYIDQIPGAPEMDAVNASRETELIEQLYGTNPDRSPGGGTNVDFEDERGKIQSAFGLVRSYAQADEELARHTLNAIASCGAFLAQPSMPSGPIFMVLISAGVAARPGYSYREIVNERVDELNTYIRTAAGPRQPLLLREDSDVDLTELIKRVSTALSDGKTTLYTVDAQGLPMRFGENPAQGDKRYTLPPGLRTFAHTDREQSLSLMARETGGLAFVSSGNYEHVVAEIHRDTAFRYVLGFRPSAVDSEPGTIVPIEVTTTRPDVQVRARKGYVAPRR